jgi:hypothetical protein
MIDIFPLQKHADCGMESVNRPAVKKIDFCISWQHDQIMPLAATPELNYSDPPGPRGKLDPAALEP